MLDEKSDFFGDLFENDHVIMLLINPESGDIVESNRAASLFYGWSQEQLSQMKIWEINTSPIEQVKEDMRLANSKMQKNFSFVHKLAAGGLRNVEVINGPIEVKGQKLIYSIVNSHTGKKFARQKHVRLKHARQKYQKYEKLSPILDFASDAIATLDYSGQVLDINETMSRKVGRSRKELAGKTISSLFSDERNASHVQPIIQGLQAVFDTGEASVCEDCWAGIPVENRFYPIYKEGKIVEVALFSTDITYRKKAEEESKRKEEYQAKLKTITEFYTNVSHELKTPLSLILIQHELMEVYLKDENMLRKQLTVAQQNSNRLSKLVGNLLDITKIEAGFLNVRLANVNLPALVGEICESVETYTNAKSIRLTVKSSLNKERMPVDVEKMERIMLNLLSNAIKHTRENGSISVCLKNRKGGGVKVIVQDTGEGIPLDMQEYIFDRFAQVDSSATRNEGSGIGLALVKSLVEVLQGTIRVKSELNKGSQFIVELPLLQIESDAKFMEIEGYDLKKRAAMELADL